MLPLIIGSAILIYNLGIVSTVALITVTTYVTSR